MTYDPLGCQVAMGIQQLPYMQESTMANSRALRGDRQVFCWRCSRYRWDEQHCPEFAEGFAAASDPFDLLEIGMKAGVSEGMLDKISAFLTELASQEVTMPAVFDTPRSKETGILADPQTIA
ncbi:MAG: hypothetical protein ACRC62_15795 [Microcoleus sp.]